MKRCIKYLSLAAIAMVGAMMTGCSNDEIVAGDNNGQQSVSKKHTVTLKTVISFDNGGDVTRSIDENGIKTLAVNDQIAVIYKNTNGETMKALSNALTENDIADGGKSATFTVTMSDPCAGGAVRYIYPAAMAAETVATDTDVDADATVNYGALAEQDGTLATLAAKYDLAIYDGTMTETATLPSGMMQNKLTICAYTLKNSDASKELNNTITGMTMSVGSNTYGINRLATADPIYIAIRPTTSATLSFTATTGATTYMRSLHDITYTANKKYNIGMKMTEVPGAVSGMFSVGSDTKVIFSKGNLQATYDGTSWTWAFAENQWNCIGKATGNTKLTDSAPFISENATVDLFSWVGTSSPWTDVNMYGITAASKNNTNYGAGSDVTLKSDWGTLAISNGGNETNSGWRTPTGNSSGEWKYLFEERTTASGILYASATVNDIKGIILLPDDWRESYHTLDDCNKLSSKKNIITESIWKSDFEAHGAVFLPAAGYRSGTSVSNANIGGYYWSTTANGSGSTYHLRITSSALQTASTGLSNSYGMSVRLVRTIE